MTDKEKGRYRKWKTDEIITITKDRLDPRIAQFWDTHDATEFEDELEVVDEPVFERPVGITVQLETADAQALRGIANALGLQEAELVRQWVLERIPST